LPAVVYTLWVGIRDRSPGLLVVAGTFATTYAFFALTSRPIFLYASLSLVPLGFIATCYAVDCLARRWEWPALGVAVLWSLYLLPVTKGLHVPQEAYGWLIEMAKRAG
jgi:hypothetical protein